MGNVVDVPENVRAELLAVLATRYKELESNEQVERPISYSSSKNPKVRYEATVRYVGENFSQTATFAYEEREDRTYGRIFQWHCTRDWLD